LSVRKAMENYGILLVDDEPLYHRIVSALASARGVAVHGVDDGEAALAAIRARPFDMVLMDIEMRGIDGYAVASAIRSGVKRGAAVPIIAFTTLSPAGGERHFLDRGFDGWLAKPFGASTFHATLDGWLGAAAIVDPAGSPEQRLGRLLGEGAARDLLGRFRAGLSEAVAEIEAGADTRPLGHRIGGLAGTLGFATLSAAWLAMEQDAGAWPMVRALTEEALGEGIGTV